MAATQSYVPHTISTQLRNVAAAVTLFGWRMERGVYVREVEITWRINTGTTVSALTSTRVAIGKDEPTTLAGFDALEQQLSAGVDPASANDGEIYGSSSPPIRFPVGLLMEDPQYRVVVFCNASGSSWVTASLVWEKRKVPQRVG